MIRNAKVFGYQLCSFLSEISSLTPCAQEHQLGILQQLEQHIRLEAGPPSAEFFMLPWVMMIMMMMMVMMIVEPTWARPVQPH